jgi:hypothetical protein
MTADPPARVAAMLAGLRATADEIVVAVDDRVDPDALAAYDGVADRVVRFGFRPPVDRPRAWLAGQCSGDWLLSVDGDEVPSPALVDALPDLVAATDVVQYWLSRRWLFPDPSTWLCEAPWWPDFQVRLLRNDATLAARAEPHAGFVHVLPSRHVDAPLYHLDCVVSDAAARAAKAARYEAEAPGRDAYGGGGLNEVMYAPERWATGGARRAVPSVDRAVIDGVLAAAEQAPTDAAPTPVAPVPVASAADVGVDEEASSPQMDDGDYAVGLALVEPAVRLAPGELRPLYVEVENRGGAAWRWGLEQQPEVRVAYHWRRRGDAARVEGLRSPLPCTLRPGQSTLVPVWVQAPTVPGDHLLDIDLVHEHVRWFGSPLTVPVVVADRPEARPC